jgi:predicted lipid-binding transport protein (Tim44 family)
MVDVKPELTSMTRLRPVLAVLFAVALALAPGVAFARAGGGSSMGSRGGMTFSAPPATRTAPYAAPIQRSMTPQSAPSPGYGAPGYAPAYGGGRSSFTSGLLGGLLGAGIGGMLFGHGMFGGMSGGGSVIGLLIQLALLFFIGRWLFRTFFQGQALFAGGGGAGAGMGGAPPGPPPRGGGMSAITITPADYTAFEQLLQAMQAAWSAQDLNRLRSIATPEMVSYFGEQLAELTSRGLRNIVRDVRLEQGDLSQAWSEGSREYATVAMRFSMIDVTADAQGRIVDGSPEERQSVTELWTFLRSPNGRWILSAIQQTR